MMKDNKVTGNWRAIVINNKDPMGKGRIQARVFGLYDGMGDDMIPWAEYADPLMGGGRDSGGIFIPDEGDKVWVFFEACDPNQPVYFAGAPSMLDMPNLMEDGFPHTRAFKDKSGNAVIMSGAEGNERIHVVHKSGTHTLYNSNGDVIEHITGNVNRTIEGNLTELVKGERLLAADGKNTISTKESNYITAQSENNILSGGLAKIYSTGNIDINGETVNINKGGMSIELIDGDIVPTVEYSVSLANAEDVIRVASSNAVADEPEDTIPEGFPEPVANDAVEEPTEIDDAGEVTVQTHTPNCEPITKIDYNYKISENFTIGSLSTKARYKHQVRAQNGLSLTDIVCNMKALAENILEPFRAKYPEIYINSGFRVGSGKSQHLRGMAVDIQVPGWNAKKYTEVARWIIKNLDYDSFILEFGNSIWLHISYDRNKKKQRNQRLTYYPKRSPNYKPGLVNYYDNKTVIK